MLQYLAYVFEKAKKEWIKKVHHININQQVKEMEFEDENWKRYTAQEEKEIKKRIIHIYVAVKDKLHVLFWSDETSEILDIINESIQNLKWLI